MDRYSISQQDDSYIFWFYIVVLLEIVVFLIDYDVNATITIDLTIYIDSGLGSYYSTLIGDYTKLYRQITTLVDGKMMDWKISHNIGSFASLPVYSDDSGMIRYIDLHE